MTIPSILITYALSVVIFLIIDLLWLGVFAKNFYQEQIGFIMGPVQWPVAIAFYLVFLVGLMIFAIMPAIAEGSISKALLLGGMFGFFTYATYDLTNWATLKDWPVTIVWVDLVWGTVLCATIAGSVTYLVERFNI